MKDIQELFLGTGLGGGTYAIIEQGHIDMVLSSKPEERRVPFEEASGIAKYLAKKNEAMRRLDEVEEHLIRIGDITSEVRRQVSALERQANKARQYKSQWEQLKAYEIRLAVDELSSGESRAKQIEEQLQALESQRSLLDGQKVQHMASLEACNASVSTIQQQLQELRTKIVEFAGAIEQHDSQSALKTRWTDELQEQLRQIDEEENQLRQRTVQVEEQAARAQGALAEIQAQQAAYQEQLSQAAASLAVAQEQARLAGESVAAAKAQAFEAATHTSQKRNELSDLSAQLQSMEARLLRINEQRAQRHAQAEEASRRYDSQLQERDSLKIQCEQMQQDLQASQRGLDTSGTRRHELTGRLHQLREQLANERARVKLLSDLWRRYEGFPETVKTLMSSAIDGLIGPLVDIIQAQPGYEEVVEAALGPLAEAIVVRDRHVLTRCKDVLTNQQLEGCRFLVLTDCPSDSAAIEQTTVAAHEGMAGPVKQFVRTEPGYQPLLDWVLNDSWVIDDLHRLLGNGVVPQQRLVSPRGDRWDRRSWRFGGNAQPAHSRVGRRQRWEHAQAYLQVVEQDAERMDVVVKDAEQEWQTRLGETESIKGQLSQVSSRLQQLESQLSYLNTEVGRTQQEQQAFELEISEATARQAELQAGRLAAEQALQSLQEQAQKTEQLLAEAQAVKEASENSRQQFIIADAQLKAAEQSLAERASSLQARAQEVEADRAHLLSQQQTKQRQRQEALNRIADLQQQLEAHQLSRQQALEEQKQQEAELERVNQLLRGEEEKRNQVVPHVLAVEQQLSSLGRQIQEQGQQLSERGFRRQRLLERLRELYQIDEVTLQAELQASSSALTEDQRKEMADQVQKLRGKLEGMGPVSLGSVDEYDELKRRLDFLQTQQQDLVQSREDLKNSITQINRTARTQFRETFERIRQEFQHYYTKLFNGGQADLILMDEENVLECGIDIVARPPGKRLQSISLLSGGERALTAISLLFALFKVRPSPFCILDEIDAPLDEANVDRFTRVLEEFLSLSQFILITHNKKTITKADSLYGVTMAEAGISQILSAKLSKQTPAASAEPAPTTPIPA